MGNLLLKQPRYKQAINHSWQLLALCECLELKYVTVSSILEQRNPWAFASEAELWGDAAPEGFHWSCGGSCAWHWIFWDENPVKMSLTLTVEGEFYNIPPSLQHKVVYYGFFFFLL